MAAFETYCAVKYVDWPSSGLTVTNEGTRGSSDNGTAYENKYGTTGQISNGVTATYFGWPDSNQQVTIPLDSNLDNLKALSLEFIVYIGTLNTTMNLISKLDTIDGLGFSCGATPGNLSIHEKTTGGWDVWDGSAQYVYAGNYYHIVVTWARGTNAGNAPIFYVNGVVVSNYRESSGGTSPWHSNTGTSWVLGQPVGSIENPFGGSGNKIILFRLHTVALTQAQVTQNMQNDMWRAGVFYLSLTAPTATTSTYAPIQAVVGPTLTAPNGTTVTTAPTQSLATTLAAPNSTTSTNPPTQAVAGPMLTAPTATTTTNSTTQAVAGPTLTAPSGVTATNTPAPDVAPRLITPTATTHTNALNSASATKVYLILSTPTATTDTYAPVISGISSVALTAPTAHTATYAPTQAVASTLATLQNATTATPAMAQSAVTTTLRAPTATTATSTIMISHRRVIELLNATLPESIPLTAVSRNNGMLTAIREQY